MGGSSLDPDVSPWTSILTSLSLLHKRGGLMKRCIVEVWTCSCCGKICWLHTKLNTETGHGSVCSNCSIRKPRQGIASSRPCWESIKTFGSLKLQNRDGQDRELGYGKTGSCRSTSMVKGGKGSGLGSTLESSLASSYLSKGFLSH